MKIFKKLLIVTTFRIPFITFLVHNWKVLQWLSPFIYLFVEIFSDDIEIFKNVFITLQNIFVVFTELSKPLLDILSYYFRHISLLSRVIFQLFLNYFSDNLGTLLWFFDFKKLLNGFQIFFRDFTTVKYNWNFKGNIHILKYFRDILIRNYLIIY